MKYDDRIIIGLTEKVTIYGDAGRKTVRSRIDT